MLKSNYRSTDINNDKRVTTTHFQHSINTSNNLWQPKHILRTDEISHKHALLVVCFTCSECVCVVYHLWLVWMFCNICLSTVLHGYYMAHNACHSHMHTHTHGCLVIDLLNLSQSIKLNLSLIILVPNCLSIRNR